MHFLPDSARHLPFPAGLDRFRTQPMPVHSLCRLKNSKKTVRPPDPGQECTASGLPVSIHVNLFRIHTKSEQLPNITFFPDQAFNGLIRFSPQGRARLTPVRSRSPARRSKCPPAAAVPPDIQHMTCQESNAARRAWIHRDNGRSVPSPAPSPRSCR